MAKFCKIRFFITSLFALLLVGCEPNTFAAVPALAEEADTIPSRMPTPPELLAITAPGYKTSQDAQSDCLGRLIFDVKKKVEWPVFYRQSFPKSIFNRSFSANVGVPADKMRYGNTLIAVIGSVEGVDKKEVFRSSPFALRLLLERNIEKTRTHIAELKRLKSTDAIREEIAEEEEWIRRRQSTLDEGATKFERFDSGLPDTEGYWTSEVSAVKETERYSVLRAYVTRREHIFLFESTVEMKSASDKERHKKDFSTTLANFRPRAPNEIPAERGVCIPFGFIADDGNTPIEFKQSLRFSDAPGVVFTIETGNVDPRMLKATPLLAAAEAMIRPPSSSTEDEVRPILKQRIGPRQVTMGGLTASQGGVVIEAKQPDGERQNIYSVFTGYGGWLGTKVLPYIIVNMRTFTKDQAKELKQNPPPFEVSKDRLDLMIKSMRWRPTNPPMPEFVAK